MSDTETSKNDTVSSTDEVIVNDTNKKPNSNSLASTQNSIQTIINEVTENNPAAEIIVENGRQIIQNVANLASNLTKNETVHKFINDVKDITSKMAISTSTNTDPDLQQFRNRKNIEVINEEIKKDKPKVVNSTNTTLNPDLQQFRNRKNIEVMDEEIKKDKPKIDINNSKTQRLVAYKLLLVLHEICKKKVYPQLKKDSMELVKLFFLHLFFHYITTKILKY
jgi:hypothetical protein